MEHLKDRVLVEIVHLIINKLEEVELHLGHTVKINSITLQVILILSILKHVELDLEKPGRQDGPLRSFLVKALLAHLVER